MILFVGIDLPSDIKHDLFNLSKQILPHTQGSITREQNYHLTLAFLGELDESMPERLIHQLSNLKIFSFKMTLDELSYFQKGEKFIYYMGVIPNPELKSLYQATIDLIKPLNLSIHGSFSPHITLIRQGKAYPVQILINHQSGSVIVVNEVTLFQSHTINDELIYTPLYRVKLSKTND